MVLTSQTVVSGEMSTLRSGSPSSNRTQTRGVALLGAGGVKIGVGHGAGGGGGTMAGAGVGEGSGRSGSVVWPVDRGVSNAR